MNGGPAKRGRPALELPALQRLLFTPVAAVRPYLVLKGTLLLLGFDLWLTRASHAGRYGAGGFNVAHFAWLDAIQPPVSPEVYVGVCVVGGALCFAAAFGDRPPRWLLALVLLVYSWSWAMSMLDSYQHHYLFSLVILCFLFFPPLTAEQALAAPPPRGERAEPEPRQGAAQDPRPETPLFAPLPRASAWGYALLGASTAVVYAYTAYSKSDPEWLSGAAFRRVLRLPIEAPPPGVDDPLAPFRVLLGAFGIEGEPLWYLMGHSVVLVQVVCAAGYLLSPLRDAARSWALEAFMLLAFFTALSFHLGAEYMELKIGWFSWYMVAYPALFFLPASWVGALARAALPLEGARRGPEGIALLVVVSLSLTLLGLGADVWPLTALGVGLVAANALRYVTRALWRTPGEPVPGALVATVLASAAALSAVAGRFVDLPGAETAGWLVAAGTLAVAALARARGVLPRRLLGYGLGVAVAAIAFAASVHFSDVRWDYYRNVGGDHRRRGEALEAFIAYSKANRYAPEGEDRDRQLSEMRRALEAEGTPIPEVE